MADIGTAYVKIEPTAKGISAKLAGEFKNSGAESGSSFGGSFGSAVSTALGGVGSIVASVTKMAAGAVAVGTSAVAGLATAALSSYANYEQLVGGVDKLYGDASAKLQQYAAEAYKTSGMSANQYMETATSFSAALVSSLGVDVNKAAEMTDLAMRTMSDNVNVFGSDAQSVQNAFQGFAKQNYTMLDNLKLGYGGTKQEMQRLIDDANKWAAENGKAADLSIDKFSDVVTAIDYIQQAQHIAGTTAKEAMSTIEGSATATKAAWQNVITALGSGEGLNEAFQGLISSLFGEKEGEGLINQILPRIKTILESITEFIGTAAPLFAEKIPEIIDAVLPSLVQSGFTLISAFAQSLIDNIDTLLFTAGDIIEQLLEAMVEASANSEGFILEIIESLVGVFEENYTSFFDMGFEILTNILQGCLDNLAAIVDFGLTIIESLGETIIEYAPELISAAADIILELSNGIAEHLDDLLPIILNVILTIVESLIDNADKLVDSAIAIILGLSEGLINALPTLIEKAPVIVEKLVDALIANAPKLLVAAGELILAIVQGTIDSLPEIFAAGGQIVGTLIEGVINLLADLLQAGKDVVEEFKEGLDSFDPIEWGKDMIDNFIQGIKDKIGDVRSACENIAQTIKDILGFSEPKEGPLSNFHTYAPDMVNLFAKGLKDNETIIQKQLEQTFSITPYQDVAYQTTSSSTYEPATVQIDSQGVMTRIEAMLNKYLPNIGNDIVLDTGELVGATTNKYNDSLGRLAVTGAMR